MVTAGGKKPFLIIGLSRCQIFPIYGYTLIMKNSYSLSPRLCQHSPQQSGCSLVVGGTFQAPLACALSFLARFLRKTLECWSLLGMVVFGWCLTRIERCQRSFLRTDICPAVEGHLRLLLPFLTPANQNNQN